MWEVSMFVNYVSWVDVWDKFEKSVKVCGEEYRLRMFVKSIM